MDVSKHGHSFHPNKCWTSKSRELILSYVQYISIGHIHGNPVRWPYLPAGNALSRRQMWQMNTQHDPGVFVIWCSLSNRFTADDSGQRRTKCSTPKVKNIFLKGITRQTLTSQPSRPRCHCTFSLNASQILSLLFMLLFLNLTNVVTAHVIGHFRWSLLLSLRTVQPSIYLAGTA